MSRQKCFAAFAICVLGLPRARAAENPPPCCGGQQQQQEQQILPQSTTTYRCPIYMTTPGSPDNVYYCIDYSYDSTTQQCTMIGPSSLTGQYTVPTTCPNCVPIGFARKQQASFDRFPGYPGPVKDESFDPTKAPADQGGLPDNPGPKPVRIDRRLAKFKQSPDAANYTYASLYSISIRPRDMCRDQSGTGCARFPRIFVMELGYEVKPAPGNEGEYALYDAEPLATKVFRVHPDGAAKNPADWAIVTLAEGK